VVSSADIDWSSIVGGRFYFPSTGAGSEASAPSATRIYPLYTDSRQIVGAEQDEKGELDEKDGLQV